MIKIIVVEDHHVVRASFLALLDKNAEIEIVGEASTGAELLALLDKGVVADIILSDIVMPEMDGIEMVIVIRERKINIPVVLLSILEEEKYASNAFKAGVNGYLSKNVEVDELMFCLHQVLKGKRYFASELCIRILDRFNNQLNNFSIDTGNRLSFSERELNVLKLVTDGMTNQEIADRLFLSRRTVEGIRQALLDRTGCKNSASLTRFAVQNNYVI